MEPRRVTEPTAHICRDDVGSLPHLLECERQTRRDEVAIDLEDRSTKKGTPPRPSEAGDIRDLRRRGAGNGTATTKLMTDD